MMFKALLLIVMLVFLLNTSSALAWYDFGHEVVAAIAYKKLTPQTKDRVNSLLKLNPYYQTWSAKASEHESDPDRRNLEIFALAATWPDVIKKDSAYHADGAEGGNKPDSPECAQNIGCSDKRMHKYWHYADDPFSPDKTPLPPYATPNAQTQIDAFRKVLASDSPDELKSYDLTWLLHLVGDIHQPLHCVTRVTKGDPNGDKGGNDVKLNATGDEPKQLHGFWDSAVCDDRNVESALAYAAFASDANKKQVAKSDASVWVGESFKLAKQKVYKSPIKSDNGPFTLTEKYKESARKIAQERVELAGARSANLLNHELK